MGIVKIMSVILVMVENVRKCEQGIWFQNFAASCANVFTLLSRSLSRVSYVCHVIKR